MVELPEKEKTYFIKSRLLDRKRKLSLTSEYLEFENKDLKSHVFTIISKSDIKDLKHQSSSLVFYKFVIGRRFDIQVKYGNDEVLKITVRGYLKNAKTCQIVYDDIVKTFWEYYFSRVVWQDIDQLDEKDKIELAGVVVDRYSVLFNGKSIFWNDLGYKEHHSYFSLFSKSDNKLYITIDFDRWESERLFSVVKIIMNDLKERKKI